MCRRIRQTRSLHEWLAAMSLGEVAVNYPVKGIWKTGIITVENPHTYVTNHDGELAFGSIMWGRKMPWNDKMVCYHAKAEKLFDPVWIGGTEKSRVLIPCSAWREGDGIFTSNQIFNLAALKFSKGFVVVTKESTSKALEYHGRMPVILDRHESIRWLSRGITQTGIEEIVQRDHEYMISVEHKPAP